MEYRFRQMRIAAGHLEDFAREWSDQVLPLRSEAGFVTHSAWLCEDGTFLWLLGHPGDFAARPVEYFLEHLELLTHCDDLLASIWQMV